MPNIEKAKNHEGKTIFPVTVSDAVLMGNGQTLKGKLSELGSEVEGLNAETIRGFDKVESFDFDVEYGKRTLSFIIPKGTSVKISGDIALLRGRTNESDEDSQNLTNGTIADRDIKYIRNTNETGSVSIGYMVKGLLFLEEVANEVKDNTEQIEGLNRDIEENDVKVKTSISDLGADLINGTSNSVQLVYDAEYTTKELPFVIRKGTKVEMSGDISTLLGRTNTEDETYQTLTDGTIADRDIKYVRTRTTIGVVVVSFSIKGNNQISEEIKVETERLNKVQESAAKTVVDVEEINETLYGEGIKYADQTVDITLPGAKITLPSTIPSGTTIISVTITDEEGNILARTATGRTNRGDSEKITLSAGVVTDRDINVVTNGSHAGLCRIVCEKFSKGLVDEVNDLKKGTASGELPTINIPNVIYAVEGDTLQIFHRSVISGTSLSENGIVVDCSVGHNFTRYYEFTPSSSNVGKAYDASYNVFNVSGEVAVRKSFKIIVKSKMQSVSTEKNVLVVGASHYSDGVIASELNRRLTNTDGDGTPNNPTGLGLSNINFVGRKKGSLTGINQEATGGYGWGTYTTDAFKDIRFYVPSFNLIKEGDQYTISGVSASETYYLTIKEINNEEGNILCEVYGGYTFKEGVIPESGQLLIKKGSGDSVVNYSSVVYEPGNPFWFNGKVDFKSYSNEYCNGKDIDCIVCHFGSNDFKTMDDLVKVENRIIPFIERFHEDFPNGKVVLGSLILGSPNGGYGTSSGASLSRNFYSISLVYWALLGRLNEIANNDNYKGYVVLADTCGEFDSEFGFPYKEKNVNNRVTDVKERIDTDRIHPTTTTKKMISDSLYRAFHNLGWS